MDFHFVDQITKFLKKDQSEEKLQNLNIFQFYIKRTGLGLNISKKIIDNCAVHPSVKINNYSLSIFNKDIKNIFVESIDSLDDSVQNQMINSLRNIMELYNYRGSRYKEKLPLNGQRRRANAKTIKKIKIIN